MKWHVKLLPIAEDELMEIPADMQARFLHISELLEELGPQNMGMPHIRHLEDKLWEMRMTGRDGIARAVYVARTDKLLTVLHVFIKKHRKPHARILPLPMSDYGALTMTDLSQLKARLLANPETRAEYDDQAPEFAIARELITARVRAGLTQDEIAKRMHTTQSTIARLESGRTMPSMRTLTRYAEATGSRAVIRLEEETA